MNSVLVARILGEPAARARAEASLFLGSEIRHGPLRGANRAIEGIAVTLPPRHDPVQEALALAPNILVKSGEGGRRGERAPSSTELERWRDKLGESYG